MKRDDKKSLGMTKSLDGQFCIEIHVTIYENILFVSLFDRTNLFSCSSITKRKTITKFLRP